MSSYLLRAASCRYIDFSKPPAMPSLSERSFFFRLSFLKEFLLRSIENAQVTAFLSNLVGLWDAGSRKACKNKSCRRHAQAGMRVPSIPVELRHCKSTANTISCSAALMSPVLVSG